MKLALCLSGLSHGKNDKGDNVPSEKSIQFLKKNVLHSNDIDIFFHTWIDDSDRALEQKIADQYFPKKCIFEKKKEFKNDKILSIINSSEYITKWWDHLKHHPNGKDAFAKKYHSTKSKWYSFMKSIELKSQYESENNFLYDIVLICRFDNCFLTKFKFDDLKDEVLYSSIWEHNPMFVDSWFVSDTCTMNKFSKLYNYIDLYLARDMVLLSNHKLSQHHAEVQNIHYEFIKHHKIDYDLERWLK